MWLTDVWDELVDYEKVSYTTLKMLIVIAITKFMNWSGFTAHLKEIYNKIDEEENSANGVASRVAADGVADGAADGVPDGVADGVEDAVADGVADGVEDAVADGVAEGNSNGVADESLCPSCQSLVPTNSSKSIIQTMIIAAKMIFEMLQKFVIMVSLIILTENTLKQWLCEPFLSLVQLEELRSIPKITRKMYQVMYGVDEPEELGEVNENQNLRPRPSPIDIDPWDWDLLAQPI